METHNSNLTPRCGIHGGGKPVNIMGAGLSGLAAATILAKAGVEVHVHDIEKNQALGLMGIFKR